VKDLSRKKYTLKNILKYLKIKLVLPERNILKKTQINILGKKNSKFKSKPCELLKRKLKEKNIIFVEEYQPSFEKYYSIDIAFPNKKIGVEVNGNQHYNNDGTLKKYYVNRNNYLKSIGWEMYDIHYSVIYCDNIIVNIINKIKNFSLTCKELDYYRKKHFDLKEKRNVKHHCVVCGDIVYKEILSV